MYSTFMSLEVLEVHFDCAGSQNLGAKSTFRDVQGIGAVLLRNADFVGRRSTLDMVVIFDAL